MTPGQRRTIIRHLPLAGALAGMALIFGSFIVLANDSTRIVLITVGTLCLLGGIWYAANPFFRSGRRYWALRAEVARFMQLVRRLNRAATARGSPGEIEQLKSAMCESVSRMAEVAGNEGRPPEE